jgi:hypothetical protein
MYVIWIPLAVCQAALVGYYSVSGVAHNEVSGTANRSSGGIVLRTIKTKRTGEGIIEAVTLNREKVKRNL